MEVGYTNTRRESLLTLKLLVQVLSEVWFSAEGLKNEYAHADKALPRWIIALVYGVEQNQYHKVMCSVGVNDEGPEALVALKSLPEEYEHLGCPCE